MHGSLWPDRPLHRRGLAPPLIAEVADLRVADLPQRLELLEVPLPVPPRKQELRQVEGGLHFQQGSEVVDVGPSRDQHKENHLGA